MATEVFGRGFLVPFFVEITLFFTNFAIETNHVAEDERNNP